MMAACDRILRCTLALDNVIGIGEFYSRKHGVNSVLLFTCALELS